MNYKIILDIDELKRFLHWLPDLEPGECYYVCLFARKKYHLSAHNDKTQCKRFTATSKLWLLKKIKQLEIPLGCFTNKDGSSVHNDSLALYITANPRSFMRAQRILLKKLADTISENRIEANPYSLSMSAIQKAKSRTALVDFDFDGIQYHLISELIEQNINRDSYTVLNTKGGFHLLVDPRKVKCKINWYNYLTGFASCDVSGDNLIPIAGCTQGGYIPKLLKEEKQNAKE